MKRVSDFASSNWSAFRFLVTMILWAAMETEGLTPRPAADDPLSSAADTVTTSVLSMGDLLSTTARMIGEHPRALLILAGLFALPPALLQAIALLLGVDHSSGGLTTATSAVGLLSMGLAQATIIFAVAESMAGREPRPRASVEHVVARIGPILGTSLLVGAAIFVGLIFCILPGVYAAVVLSVAMPTAVVERLGPVEAMKRSAALTSGVRLPILGTYLVLLLIMVPLMVVSMVVGGVAMLWGGALVFLVPLFQVVASTLQNVLFATFAAVLYTRLRGIRESVDPEALAQVFA